MKILGKCDRCGKITHLTESPGKDWFCPDCTKELKENSEQFKSIFNKPVTTFTMKPEGVADDEQQTPFERAWSEMPLPYYEVPLYVESSKEVRQQVREIIQRADEE